MDGEAGRRRVVILELDLQYIKQSYMKISAQYVKEHRRKVRKIVYFQYSKSKKGHYSYKNWRKLTTLEVDL